MRGRRWRCSTDLLPDRERVLGRDHPETLVTRSQIALDRRYGGLAGGAAAIREPAAGPGTCAGLRPPRHTHDPSRDRVLDRQIGEHAEGGASCSPPCCRIGSGFWAATTPTRSRPSEHWGSVSAGRVLNPKDAGCCEKDGRVPKHDSATATLRLSSFSQRSASFALARSRRSWSRKSLDDRPADGRLAQVVAGIVWVRSIVDFDAFKSRRVGHVASERGRRLGSTATTSSRSATFNQRATHGGNDGGGQRRSLTIVRKPSGEPSVTSNGIG